MDMKMVIMIYLLVACSGPMALVHSQDQSGFISIDCGIPYTSSYVDTVTTIHYTSDTQFTTTGTNMVIAPIYPTGTLMQLSTLRAFPEGAKNCYTFKPEQGKGTNYLIRAFFMYGNYDSLDKPPTFDLYLGVDVWDTIKLDNSTQLVFKEIIHTLSTDHLFVCLANTGKGTPFISTLELRHLNDTIYNRGSGSLVMFDRFYASSNSSAKLVRYEDDMYDRLWGPTSLQNGSSISTSHTIDTGKNLYRLPSSVMQAAFTPKAGSDSLQIYVIPDNSSSEFYVFMHFAELEKLKSNEVREFNIILNGKHDHGPYSPHYLQADTITNSEPISGPILSFEFVATKRSTHPPILNAAELYIVKKLSQHSTNQRDVDAMMKIRSVYGVLKNWQGDPCSPKAYLWDGVNCSFHSNTYKIIYLNLSSSGLTGEIADSISSLTSLEVLDLSNNDLTGGVPDFLADLASLTTLNLTGNKLTGTVPSALLERSREGTLALSFEDDRDSCSSGSCSNQKFMKLIVPIIASVVGVLVIATIGICTVCLIKKKRKSKGKSKQGNEREIPPPGYVNKKGGALSRFSHSEVKEMTKGFKKLLGKGGFGTVYYGSLKQGSEVAVKLLQQSIEGSEQFHTEVELLMAIRHKNLVSLIGYCNEKNKLALIYEYMAKGDLDGLISSDENLSWKQRLQVAIDAAQGLDYLHNGCRPSIVHRDVKPSNILLNGNMQAKVADFGLSKMFPNEEKSYMTTRVIGTPGYLDPEYHITQQLNEKSDVYSFGVVLLELITGKRAIIKTNPERTHIIQWVSSMLDTGDIRSMVDQRLQDVQNPNSVWRMTDIAMVCVKQTSNERPTMSQIVTELKECLSMEMEVATRGNSGTSIDPNNSNEMMSPVISFTVMDPGAR